MSERWLNTAEAEAAVLKHISGSVGRAQAVLRAATKSGEVRMQRPLVLNDDGVVGARAIVIGEKLVNEDDLLDWLQRNQGPVAINAVPVRSASTQEIRSAMFSIANDPANDRPNVKRLAKLVVAQLRQAGAIASENQVITLADAEEFKALRRPPGKTKRSGG